MPNCSQSSRSALSASNCQGARRVTPAVSPEASCLAERLGQPAVLAQQQFGRAQALKLGGQCLESLEFEHREAPARQLQHGESDAAEPA